MSNKAPQIALDGSKYIKISVSMILAKEVPRDDSCFQIAGNRTCPLCIGHATVSRLAMLEMDHDGEDAAHH